MDKGEKRLIGGMVSCIAVLLGCVLWWTHINEEPTVVIPTPQLPSPNAFDFYVKAAKTHAALKAVTIGVDAIDPVTDKKFDATPSPHQLAQRYPTAPKVRWVKKCAPALQTLRQGFAYEYLAPPQRAAPISNIYLSQFRDLARLMVIESHSRSEQGDWAGASRSTLDTLRLGHDVARGGPMIAALVGYAINAIGRKELESILPHLDATAAKNAAKQIEALEAGRFPLAEAIREEKWVGLSQLQHAMRRPGWRSGIAQSWRGLPGLYFYTKQDILNNYSRYMDALLEQAGQPYPQWQPPTIPNDPLSKVLLPSINRAHWSAARHETGNVVLMVQLALRAFELEHGQLPDTLAELVPSYLKAVPRDPFGNGESLRYRRTGKTYQLYSVGSDGKDDGGTASVRTNSSPKSPNRYLLDVDSTGDYVAGINR